MIREVFMPALSSTMTEGKVVSWEKSSGDKVEKGETILVVESDKADMDVEAFYEGYLTAINTPAGESAAVGATIALIAETEAEIAEAEKQGASAPAATPASVPAATPASATPAAPAPTPAPVAVAPTVSAPSGRLIASPRAKKLAKKLKVDLATLKGSGPHGRITANDVEAATGQTSAVPMTAAAPASKAIPAPAPMPVQPGEVAAFNTLQQAVIRNMNASLAVPTFHVSYAITTDALDKLYKQIKPKGVTMTAILAKAIAMTLQQHPVVNASFTEQGTHYNGGINVAIAVAMPDGGLITPVLQNADQIDIYSLSRTWKDLVSRSRSKQLQPDEYSTGTFTLSNLGMFGVDTFDAILPPGQGSILAVGGLSPLWLQMTMACWV